MSTMITMGAFNAKTHFSQLLQEIEKGHKVLITKHGHEIAMIVPISKMTLAQTRGTVSDAIRKIRQLRRNITLGKKLSIQTLRDMGRK